MIVPRILTLALSCAAASAGASPRSDPTAGRAVFTGATMPHATSIGVDPAALGLGSVDELYIAFTGVLDQLHVALDRGPDNQAPGGQAQDVEVSPGAMLAFIYHLAGDSLTLGFEAHTAPPETFPSHQSALQYHVAGGGERDWLASVGASYKVADILFVGASLSHQNTFLRLQYTRDAALESPEGPGAALCGGAPCGIGNPDAAQKWDVDVRSPSLSTSNLKVNVGVLVQIAHDVWLGIGYHTPPGFGVESELAGHVAITNPDLTVLREQSVVDIQLPASADAELRARLPAGLDLHVGGRWEDLSRLSAYDVRAYSSTSVANGIPEWTERPRGMHDAFAGWAGVEQVDRGQSWLLGARGGFETASVSAARTSPLTVAPASVTLDLGAQLRVSRGLIAQLSYGLQYFPTLQVSRSDFDPEFRVACMQSNYDYTTAACAATRNGYAIASAAGSYDRIEHALRLGLRYDLP
ncbi:MAG TPA: hypothetical protein VF516_12120 [Kofleriaceae bacterium]